MSSSTIVKSEPHELSLPVHKPRPPPKPKTITDIFPEFKQGDILDFVDMFACGINPATKDRRNQIRTTAKGGDKHWDLTSGPSQTSPLFSADLSASLIRISFLRCTSGDPLSASRCGAVAHESAPAVSATPAQRRTGPLELPPRGLCISGERRGLGGYGDRTG